MNEWKADYYKGYLQKLLAGDVDNKAEIFRSLMRDFNKLYVEYRQMRPDAQELDRYVVEDAIRNNYELGAALVF